ncbi:MAG: elongator complex protein 3 [Syntrophales bacterium]
MIIPFFLMNRGCRHRCIFCNERLLAGDHPATITAAAFAQTVRAHLDSAPRKRGPVQIAFYGGTFTALEEGEQRRLLGLATPFLREGLIDGIRLSTRPDEIDSQGLDLLKAGGVTTIEVGAQSLDDEVLRSSRRGHGAAETIRALGLLKERGFTRGLHLMAGLPGDDGRRFRRTVERAVSLGPDMVRIHPAVVLRDTELEAAYRAGSYTPLTRAEAVAQCADAWKLLASAGIPVIRLGLQTTRELEAPGAVVAGPFHPSFRSLVEAALLREMAEALLEAAASGEREAAFTLAPSHVSVFPGERRANIAALRVRFGLARIGLTGDPGLPPLTLLLRIGGAALRTDATGTVTLLAG